MTSGCGRTGAFQCSSPAPSSSTTWRRRRWRHSTSRCVRGRRAECVLRVRLKLASPTCLIQPFWAAVLSLAGAELPAAAAAAARSAQQQRHAGRCQPSQQSTSSRYCSRCLVCAAGGDGTFAAIAGACQNVITGMKLDRHENPWCTQCAKRCCFRALSWRVNAWFG